MVYKRERGGAGFSGMGEVPTSGGAPFCMAFEGIVP